MILPVSDNYRITTDEHQYIVQRRRVAGEKAKTPGAVDWEPLTYHPTLDSACLSVSERLGRDVDACGCAAVVEALAALTDAVCAAARKEQERAA